MSIPSIIAFPLTCCHSSISSHPNHEPIPPQLVLCNFHPWCECGRAPLSPPPLPAEKGPALARSRERQFWGRSMPLRNLLIGDSVHRLSSGCRCCEVPVLPLVYCYILLEHAATCLPSTFQPIIHIGNWFNCAVCNSQPCIIKIFRLYFLFLFLTAPLQNCFDFL